MSESQNRPRRAMADADRRSPRRLSAKARTRVDARVPFERMRGSARWWWLGVDLGVLMLLAGLQVVAWLPTFGWGWVAVTVLGGSAIGLVIAWLGWRFRWNSAGVLAAGLVGWFALGGVLAMPSSTIAGVVPTMRTLVGLATGPVTAPKAVLTLEPPIGETWNLLTLPLLVALVSAAAGLSISLRSRRPALAWVPSTVALMVSWALGTAVTHLPAAVAIATVVIVLVWTSTRRRMIRETLVGQRRRSAWLTPLIGALVLAFAGGLTWVVATPLTPTAARAIARHQVEPPLEINRYASPLQQFRGEITMDETTALLSVSGMPRGAAIRVATLDTYDGLTYNVSNADTGDHDGGVFTRVGARIVDQTPGTRVEATVTVLGYDNPWVPTVGRTTAVRFEGARGVALTDSFHYNRSSGTGIATAGLRQGDTYTVHAIVPQRPSDSRISQAGAGDADLPAPQNVPDSVKDLALRWTAGSATKGEAALKLERALQQGWFSHGQDDEVRSLSGHSYDRLQALLANPQQMVGDEEQFAVAMALMARQLGIPARVVYGFRAQSASGEVRGQDVRAWTEVQLEGLGWVMFNPTPDHDRVLKKVSEETPPRPRPHVDNPPPVPRKPQAPPGDNNLEVEAAPPPEAQAPIDWRRVGTVAAVVGLPAVTVVGPLVLVLGLKTRRRLQRRHHPVVANRVAGAWSELVDTARDLGRSPAPTATRSEQAEAMVVQFPRMIELADPIALAKRADAVVFSADDISEEHAAGYWMTLGEAEKGVRRSVPWWRWVRSRLSTRSFRSYR
ncbi:transglutaminaseTgpA domain-containing protein [Aestuariimicrobium kwangyangense]|uniref:transglutaminase family protein n=1 Tax=Aestuariimicrobium kwangyangense TaxID=396389 RepID=UPI000402CC69|nr:transglutaminase domain-containing protein [Aestuariimicrobium kwangyangense]